MVSFSEHRLPGVWPVWPVCTLCLVYEDRPKPWFQVIQGKSIPDFLHFQRLTQEYPRGFVALRSSERCFHCAFFILSLCVCVLKGKTQLSRLTKTLIRLRILNTAKSFAKKRRASEASWRDLSSPGIGCIILVSHHLQNWRCLSPAAGRHRRYLLRDFAWFWNSLSVLFGQILPFHPARITDQRSPNKITWNSPCKTPSHWCMQHVTS